MTRKTPAQRLEYYYSHREKCLDSRSRWYRRNKEKQSEYNRQYAERLKRGEIQLPPLDWAICARGGSAAQARAHYRRGEKPCPACLRAAAADAARRKELRKQARMAA